MKSVDAIIQALPEYSRMRGSVSDEAILAHACTVYPETTSLVLTQQEIYDHGLPLFGINPGAILKTAGNVIKGVVGAAKGVVTTFNKKYKAEVSIKERTPTAEEVARKLAGETTPKEKKGIAWYWFAGAGGLALVIVLLVAFGFKK
jgi:hypothetical protein